MQWLRGLRNAPTALAGQGAIAPRNRQWTGRCKRSAFGDGGVPIKGDQVGGGVMESLGAKQERFANLLPDLLVEAQKLNPARLGDLFRDPRVHGEMGVKKGYGHPNSCHKLKLAIDINFVVNGQVGGGDLHMKLHDYWDSVGGSGRIMHDLNHYSLEHNGYK
jgi:hypothetical protein